jgi:hypothetical protein
MFTTAVAEAVELTPTIIRAQTTIVVLEASVAGEPEAVMVLLAEHKGQTLTQLLARQTQAVVVEELTQKI